MNLKGYRFRSDLFQIRKGEDDYTNPLCFGEELAEWLSDELSSYYHEVSYGPEDWGWYIMCSSRGYQLFVGCASIIDNPKAYDSSHPPAGHEVIWHVFPVIKVSIFHFNSWIKKMIGQFDTKPIVMELDARLKQILDDEPRIELL